MTTIKISASCPYEIGDKIVTGREIHPPELAFKFPAAVRTITDIVCQYSAQTGEAVFLYELDAAGSAAAEEETEIIARRSGANSARRFER